MTAFARVSASAREGQWVMEIRSLNSRYFDFSLKIPPVLSSLETRIRDLTQAELRRGKITVGISQDSKRDKANGLSLDEDVIRLHLTQLRKLKKKFKIEGEFTVSDILGLPGIFTGEESEADPEKLWPALKKVLIQTLKQAVKAKELEGRKLAKDIEERLGRISNTVEEIESKAKGEPKRIFKKLSERVAALLGDGQRDPEYLAREVAFLAERSDITEEMVRMRSHLQLFSNRLKGNAEIGRELDFLCQEMNREVNTMGSKSQLFEISTGVVFMKGELEKIREQIQNIE